MNVPVTTDKPALGEGLLIVGAILACYGLAWLGIGVAIGFALAGVK